MMNLYDLHVCYTVERNEMIVFPVFMMNYMIINVFSD